MSLSLVASVVPRGRLFSGRWGRRTDRAGKAVAAGAVHCRCGSSCQPRARAGYLPDLALDWLRSRWGHQPASLAHRNGECRNARSQSIADLAFGRRPNRSGGGSGVLRDCPELARCRSSRNWLCNRRHLSALGLGRAGARRNFLMPHGAEHPLVAMGALTDSSGTGRSVAPFGHLSTLREPCSRRAKQYIRELRRAVQRVRE
jgi:hypothetical protein